MVVTKAVLVVCCKIIINSGERAYSICINTSNNGGKVSVSGLVVAVAVVVVLEV